VALLRRTPGVKSPDRRFEISEIYNACAKVTINGPYMHEADGFITAAMKRAWPQTEDQAKRNIKGPMNAFLKKTDPGGIGAVTRRLYALKSRFDFMTR
jgi:hypothetical protein